MNTQYVLGRQLGKGAFGTVNVATQVSSGEEYALKSVLKSSVTHPVMKNLMQNELNTLVETNHVNIVDVKEIMHDETNYYISCEIIEGGQLYERILEIKSFNEKKASEII